MLFTSGYTQDATLRQGMLGRGAQFLAKPFNMSDLRAKIRGVLANPAGRGVERW